MMSTRCLQRIAAVFVCAAMLTASVAVGQGRSAGHGGPAKSDRNPSDNFRGPSLPAPAALTLHGGQYLRSDAKQFEYIIMPQQVRIYVYDKELKPLGAKDAQAHITYQLPGESRTRKIVFQYVAATTGPDQQDYLVAAFDSSTLPEKEIPITFVFSSTSDKRAGTTSFTPLISRADVRPYVMRVQYTKADAQQAARQRICPVTGAALDPNAALVKVLIAEYPVYLAREDDVAALRATPEKFLAKLQSTTMR